MKAASLLKYRQTQTYIERRWMHGSAVRTSVFGWRTFAGFPA